MERPNPPQRAIHSHSIRHHPQALSTPDVPLHGRMSPHQAGPLAHVSTSTGHLAICVPGLSGDTPREKTAGKGSVSNIVQRKVFMHNASPRASYLHRPVLLNPPGVISADCLAVTRLSILWRPAIATSPSALCSEYHGEREGIDAQRCWRILFGSACNGKVLNLCTIYRETSTQSQCS